MTYDYYDLLNFFQLKSKIVLFTNQWAIYTSVQCYLIHGQAVNSYASCDAWSRTAWHDRLDVG